MQMYPVMLMNLSISCPGSLWERVPDQCLPRLDPGKVLLIFNLLQHREKGSFRIDPGQADIRHTVFRDHFISLDIQFQR
jgi:hypothetical protein